MRRSVLLFALTISTVVVASNVDKQQRKPINIENDTRINAISSNGASVKASAFASSFGSLVIASSGSGKGCVTVKKPCGSTCSPDSKSIGKCGTAWKPKYCLKTTKLFVACNKVKMCTSTEKVAGVCKKKVKKTVRCPDIVGSRNVCTYRKVKVPSCKKLSTMCSRIQKKKCRYETIKKKVPCSRPKRPCRECFNTTVLKTCKRTVTRKVEVPCDGSVAKATAASPTPRSSPASAGSVPRSGPSSESNSPTPSASPLGTEEFLEEEAGYDPWLDDSFENGFEESLIPVTFGSAREHTRSVQCFASLFNEADCEGAPAYCQLFDDAFDSDQCTREVCRECAAIKHMQVGRELRKYCRDLRSSCHFFSRMLVTPMVKTAAVARGAVERSVETEKCYRNETKTVSAECNYRLPKSQVCVMGCRVGRCEKPVKERVTKHCSGHLPKSCTRKCLHKVVKRKECHTVQERKRSDKQCKKEETVKYKCYKKKEVKKPCKGVKSKLCAKLQPIKYVCGKIPGKLIKCTGSKGETKCVPKMCVQKKCP